MDDGVSRGLAGGGWALRTPGLGRPRMDVETDRGNRESFLTQAHEGEGKICLRWGKAWFHFEGRICLVVFFLFCLTRCRMDSREENYQPRLNHMGLEFDWVFHPFLKT